MTIKIEPNEYDEFMSEEGEISSFDVKSEKFLFTIDSKRAKLFCQTVGRSLLHLGLNYQKKSLLLSNIQKQNMKIRRSTCISCHKRRAHYDSTGSTGVCKSCDTPKKVSVRQSSSVSPPTNSNRGLCDICQSNVVCDNVSYDICAWCGQHSNHFAGFPRKLQVSFCSDSCTKSFTEYCTHIPARFKSLPVHIFRLKSHPNISITATCLALDEALCSNCHVKPGRTPFLILRVERNYTITKRKFFCSCRCLKLNLGELDSNSSTASFTAESKVSYTSHHQRKGTEEQEIFEIKPHLQSQFGNPNEYLSKSIREIESCLPDHHDANATVNLFVRLSDIENVMAAAQKRLDLLTQI